jgi:hypothetical protein
MMANPSAEAEAIETAYGAQVQSLFRTLVVNLGDEPVSRQSDQQSVDKFIAGLDVAKRARQLALKAVGAAAPARGAAARGKKKS